MFPSNVPNVSQCSQAMFQMLLNVPKQCSKYFSFSPCQDTHSFASKCAYRRGPRIHPKTWLIRSSFSRCLSIQRLLCFSMQLGPGYLEINSNSAKKKILMASNKLLTDKIAVMYKSKKNMQAQEILLG